MCNCLFHFQWSEKHELKSWGSLIADMKAEADHQEVSNLADGILAYLKSDLEIWLKVQRRLSQDNVDLAGKYAIEGLEKISEECESNMIGEILKHAVDVLTRLKTERHKLLEELEHLKQTSTDQQIMMKSKLEERDNLIVKLHEKCQQMEGILQEYSDELRKASEERKIFEKVLENAMAEIHESKKERDKAVNKLKAVSDEADQVFQKDRNARMEEEKNRNQNKQSLNVSVYQFQDPKTPRTALGKNNRRV